MARLSTFLNSQTRSKEIERILKWEGSNLISLFSCPVYVKNDFGYEEKFLKMLEIICTPDQTKIKSLCSNKNIFLDTYPIVNITTQNFESNLRKIENFVKLDSRKSIIRVLFDENIYREISDYILNIVYAPYLVSDPWLNTKVESLKHNTLNTANMWIKCEYDFEKTNSIILHFRNLIKIEESSKVKNDLGRAFPKYDTLFRKKLKCKSVVDTKTYNENFQYLELRLNLPFLK